MSIELKNCRWFQVDYDDADEGHWFTDCDECFDIMNGKPSDNHMKYCCYCGKEIKEEPYTKEVEAFEALIVNAMQWQEADE